MQIRSKSNLTILTIIVIVGVLMATLSTTVISMPIAKAEGKGPFLHLGNPNDLSTGPPIPSCTAPIHGHNEQATGCKGRNVP